MKIERKFEVETPQEAQDLILLSIIGCFLMLMMEATLYIDE